MVRMVQQEEKGLAPMYPVWNKRSATAGYTLLELLVVLSIIAVVLTALPILGSTLMPSIRFMDAENQLIADVRELKSKAQMTGIAQTLELNESQDGYRLGNSGEQRDFDGIRFGVEGVIRFFPNGSAAQGQIRLSADRQVVVVDVNGVTGAIIKKDENQED